MNLLDMLLFSLTGLWISKFCYTCMTIKSFMKDLKLFFEIKTVMAKYFWKEI